MYRCVHVLLYEHILVRVTHSTRVGCCIRYIYIHIYTADAPAQRIPEP